MNPNEETIYGGMPVENEENPQVENTQESKKEVPWKFIGLGAATGILMGAGALFASEAMASENTDAAEDTPLEPGDAQQAAADAKMQELNMPVAKVSADSSFEEAFADARAQVGPGGVFQWHGGIYNTYTKEEWDAINDADKNAFASRVRPEHPVHKIETIHITEKEPDIHIDKVEIHEHYTLNEVTEPKDDDVHVVGYVGTDNVTVNGENITVDNYIVDGHNAAIVNFEDEDKHDIAWVDKNDNLQIDNAESKDIVTGEILDQDWNPMPDTAHFTADAGEADTSAADVTSI